MILDAIRTSFDHKPPDWIIWRCPHCNCWDYRLQGYPGQTDPGIYYCDECGLPFNIPAFK